MTSQASLEVSCRLYHRFIVPAQRGLLSTAASVIHATIRLHLNRVRSINRRARRLSSAIRYVPVYRKYSMRGEIWRRPLYRLICYWKRALRRGAPRRCHRLNADINDAHASSRMRCAPERCANVSRNRSTMLPSQETPLREL